MSKQTTLSLIESLIENSKDYTEQRLELLKLKAVDRTSKAFSKIITSFLLLVIIVVFFMIFSIGLGFYLGDLIGKVYAGFFLLAAFYLIVGIILIIGKDTFFRKPIANRLIKKLF